MVSLLVFFNNQIWILAVNLGNKHRLPTIKSKIFMVLREYSAPGNGRTSERPILRF